MKVVANELSFHVVDEGQGPAVLLLHGFPDSSALWRQQIPALVEAGHRVIAPDLRGFGESDRPEGVQAYGMELLVGDVLGILDALGVERASVVGHDWGAALGWALATRTPERVQRLAALSVGHPADYFTDEMTQRECPGTCCSSCSPGSPRTPSAETTGHCCADRATSSATSPTWTVRAR